MAKNVIKRLSLWCTDTFYDVSKYIGFLVMSYDCCSCDLIVCIICLNNYIS